MAQMAAAECLTSILTERSRSLFGTSAAEVQDATRSCSTKTGFAVLAHDFFSRFTQRYLTYHLSRELPNHVGEGQRFGTPAEHTEFVNQMKVHCREAAVIVKDFAGGWYSKANFEGGISRTKAKGFVHVALRYDRNKSEENEVRNSHLILCGGAHASSRKKEWREAKTIPLLIPKAWVMLIFVLRISHVV